MHYVLGKIGRRHRMRDLVENGRVYMQQLSTYQAIESSVIGDPNEGLFLRFSAENPTLKVTARIGKDEIYLPGASITIPSSARDHAVYCMCGIVSEGDGTMRSEALLRVAQDSRMREFGDTLVLFRDSPEFVRRLEHAARTAGYDLDQGPVEYVSESHCGDMGPFRKLDRYKYQSEWRFITAEPIPRTSVVLELGPLLDIARWIDLNDVETTPQARTGNP